MNDNITRLTGFVTLCNSFCNLSMQPSPELLSPTTAPFLLIMRQVLQVLDALLQPLLQLFLQWLQEQSGCNDSRRNNS